MVDKDIVPFLETVEGELVADPREWAEVWMLGPEGQDAIREHSLLDSGVMKMVAQRACELADKRMKKHAEEE